MIEKKQKIVKINVRPYQIFIFSAIIAALIIGGLYWVRTLIQGDECNCQAQTPTHFLDEIYFDRTSDGLYKLSARSPRGTIVSNQSSVRFLDTEKEQDFDFGDIVTGKQYVYDQTFDFRTIRYDQEMMAICFKGIDRRDPANVIPLREIKGFIAIQDTKYPPPTKLWNNTANADQDAFSGLFQVQRLFISRRNDAGLFSVQFVLKQNASEGYRIKDYGYLYDNLNHVNTIVIQLERDPTNNKEDLTTESKVFPLMNYSANYKGRPGGWPGINPSQMPGGCSKVEQYWENTDAVAVVLIDERQISPTGAVNWNQISRKKAQLCFK